MAERIATAAARKEFAEIVQRSSAGTRIKLTRYGKTQAVLIPKNDLVALEDCESARSKSAKGAGKRPPGRRKSR
jgi:antitoxin (DNA-binding transcriptional repressor) of toxin-antitoxin stability system